MNTNDTKYMIYILINTSNNKTYYGITTNNDKNILLKHNGILNGAKSTYTINNKVNGDWKFYLKINNLYKKDALDIERKTRNKYLGGKELSQIQRRLNVLLPVLALYKNIDIEYFEE